MKGKPTTAWSGREPAVQLSLHSLLSGGWLPPLMLAVSGGQQARMSPFPIFFLYWV